jgi:urease
MDGVTFIVGVHTEVIAGEGLIVTAGGVDTHVHFICPQLMHEALASGVTTLVGGGTGPATGSKATTCTPHPKQIEMMLSATDNVALNIGLTGKGNTAAPDGLQAVIDAGAIGLKLHEDYGTTPAAIHMALEMADQNDIQVTIHTDTLNESSCIEHTIAAFQNRTIHTYHSEGILVSVSRPLALKPCYRYIRSMCPRTRNIDRIPITPRQYFLSLVLRRCMHVYMDSMRHPDIIFVESTITRYPVK